LSASNAARDQFVQHLTHLLGTAPGVEDCETLAAGTEFFNNLNDRLRR
jgi:hypothetical protein